MIVRAICAKSCHFMSFSDGSKLEAKSSDNGLCQDTPDPSQKPRRMQGIDEILLARHQLLIDLLRLRIRIAA